MPYSFPPDIQLLVDQSLATGMYASENEVLQAALRVLSEYNGTVADIRQGRLDHEHGLGEALNEGMSIFVVS